MGILDLFKLDGKAALVRNIVVDGGHTLNVWLHPLERAEPPLVNPAEEVVSLKHDLDLLGIPHDEDGLLQD